MLNSLYGDFSEELDFGNEAHANSLLKNTKKIKGCRSFRGV